MKATKKDFEFTASLLNAALKGTPPLNLVQLASSKFKADNPRFDEERFKEACGYYDECERLVGTGSKGTCAGQGQEWEADFDD
jgi:hypothetical protein